MEKKNILFQEVEKFISLYGRKKLVLYGAGSAGMFICAAFKGYNLDILYFVDGDGNKQGNIYMDLEVKSPFDLMEENLEEIIIVLTLSANDEAEKVLQSMGLLKDINYYCMEVETQKKFDMFDPFLGHSRMDDLQGFKIFGDLNAETKVLTLGGSTTDYSLSGIHSWPFYLQQKMKTGGVINGGMGGYYSSQELLKLLRDGIFMKPNIVISYSGINDAIGTVYVEGHPLITKYLKNEFECLPIKNKKIGFGYEKRMTEVDNWITNMRMMHALCEEFGIKFYSFLQPCIWIGNYILTEKEKKVFAYVNNYIDPKKEKQFYETIKERIADYTYIYDLTDIFSGMSGIYYDNCHCSEEGNQLIADKIFEIVSRDLEGFDYCSGGETIV